MRRITLLAVALTAAGCMTRPTPSENERRRERALRAALPPGWQVLVVTGDPSANHLACWLEAPGPEARTRRVEVRVTPRPDDPGERDWAVSVHPPVNPRSRPGSVSFVVRNDGAGPFEVAPGGNGDPAAVEAARPLAEEAVRQIRRLRLF